MKKILAIIKGSRLKLNFIAFSIFLQLFIPVYSSSAATINKSFSMPPNNLGLVGHWTFDGNKMLQNVSDSSGQNNHGSLQGQTSTTTVIGKIGQALSFDGSDDYVKVNDPVNGVLDFGTTSFSFGAWFKSSEADGGFIINKNMAAGTSPGYDLLLAAAGVDGNIQPRIRDGIVTTNGPVKTGTNDTKWHHAFAVVDRSTNLFQFYVDGIEITPAVSISTVGSVNATANLSFGGREATALMDGLIDDVRIYNRALSASEVKQLYQSGAAKLNVSPTKSLTSGLVGYWTFDGNKMLQNVSDSSGQNNHGSLQGQTSTTTVIGKIGQGLSFDGTNDNVNAGSGSSLDDIKSQSGGGMSVAFWAKVDSNSFAVLIAKGGATAGWQIQKNSSSNPARIVFRHEGTTDLLTSWNNILTTREWVNVILTWDGTTSASGVNLYRNGVLVSAVAGGIDGVTLDSDASYPLCIGGGGTSNCATSVANTDFDDVRIYNRALSAAEVQQLYNMGR